MRAHETYAEVINPASTFTGPYRVVAQDKYEVTLEVRKGVELRFGLSEVAFMYDCGVIVARTPDGPDEHCHAPAILVVLDEDDGRCEEHVGVDHSGHPVRPTLLEGGLG